MFIPITCTCGKSLAAYYDAFKLAREEKLRAVLVDHESKVLPEMMAMSEELQPLLGGVLDSMNLTRNCCRLKILTTSEFSEYY
jgi:DNA-directed RNA polymerase subunit N (RpoN/RPB10)